MNPSPPPNRLRFADFEVDLAARRLHHRGRPVGLQEKPFQLLEALLESPGRTVSREELRQRLWPASPHLEFDTSLNVAAGKLRRALGDSAREPRWLLTVTGEGYRLQATVVALTGPATTRRRPWAAVAVGLGLLVLALVGARGRWAGPTPPRLAIMPFELASRERPAELARVSEWLVAELSTPDRKLRIIGPRSTAPYSQFPFPDPGRLRDELEADFVLNARTVEDETGRSLIVELIDLHDRSHPWAQYYAPPWRWHSLAADVCQGVSSALAMDLGGCRPVVPDP